MIKRFFSNGDTVNPITGEDFVGHVELNTDTKMYENGVVAKPTMRNSILLDGGDFDRSISDKLSLPASRFDCTLHPNDWMVKSTFQRIADNLTKNNNYIFENCFVPNSNLPTTKIVTALTPKTEGDGDKDIVWDDVNLYNDNSVLPYWSSSPFWTWENAFFSNKTSSWAWAGLNYNSIENLYEYIAEFQNEKVVDCKIIPTDIIAKTTSEVPETYFGNRVYLVILAFPSMIKFMNLTLINPANLRIDNVTSETPEELAKRRLNKVYDAYDLTYRVGDAEMSSDIKVIDPNVPVSLPFGNIQSISVSGDSLFVVDSKLKGVFKYDISRFIHSRGVTANRPFLSECINRTGTDLSPVAFTNPVRVAAGANMVYVLDEAEKCVKMYDENLNYKRIIQTRLTSQNDMTSMEVCSHECTVNGRVLPAGSLWMSGFSGNEIQLSVYSNGRAVTSFTIDNVSKLVDVSKTNTLLSNAEYVINIRFSRDNYNIFYVVTNRRVIKLHLSKPTLPIGIFIYSNKSYITNDSVSNLEYPVNCGFDICSNDDQSGDVVFNVIDNRLVRSGLNDDGELITETVTLTNNKNTMLMFTEENNMVSVLSDQHIPTNLSPSSYTNIGNEYVSALTLNKLIMRIVQDLKSITSRTIGKFGGGYTFDGIPSINQIILSDDVTKLIDDVESLYIGDNEEVSLACNRAFDMIYSYQMMLLANLSMVYVHSSLNNTYQTLQ